MNGEEMSLLFTVKIQMNAHALLNVDAFFPNNIWKQNQKNGITHTRIAGTSLTGFFEQ